ncbi:mitochondrial carrier domain-containing protein [Dunaliella salina]|uniref:Mitochondrial carrier domain-containing protein n=1 Tax=Dunaliella salina TaxID=3046 RepID=A0ABQ7GMX2_DUNSA|nr:mitochondrial carrier domain-containing protein [Dunaliella salina]|eukprot:KAF5835965.1 mitochondrial carrier domain-containing protein [Dunaliella salina]
MPPSTSSQAHFCSRAGVNTHLLASSAFFNQEEDCCSARHGSLQPPGHQGTFLQWNMHAPAIRTRRKGAPPCASLSLTRNAHTHSAACPAQVARSKRRIPPALASISPAQAPVTSLSFIKQLTPSSTGKQGDEAEPAHPQSSTSSSHAPQATHSRTLNSCKLLFAGAMSAVVSRTFCAPLERLKMELVLKQGSGGTLSTARHILRHEGFSGFWRGNALNVLRTAPFKASCLPAVIGMAPAGAVFYGVYDLCKHRHLTMLESKGCPNPSIPSCYTLLYGALAGKASYGLLCGMTYSPLAWLLRCWMGPRQPASLAAALLDGALAGEAPHALLCDLNTSWLLCCWMESWQPASLAAALLDGVRAEVLRRRLQLQSMVASSTHHPTLGGRAAAAAAAAHAANKASGLQHMQQAGSKGGVRVMHTLLTIIKAEGLQGLYAGMGPNILQCSSISDDILCPLTPSLFSIFAVLERQ